jgi:hypothetical protein
VKRFPKDLQYAPSAGATGKQLELGTACGKAKHDANGRSKATRMIFAHLLRHHFEKQVGVCVDVALPEQVRRFFAQLVHPLFHPNAAPRGLRRESERSAAIEEGVREQQPERTASPERFRKVSILRLDLQQTVQQLIVQILRGT